MAESIEAPNRDRDQRVDDKETFKAATITWDHDGCPTPIGTVGHHRDLEKGGGKTCQAHNIIRDAAIEHLVAKKIINACNKYSYGKAPAIMLTRDGHVKASRVQREFALERRHRGGEELHQGGPQAQHVCGFVPRSGFDAPEPTPSPRRPQRCPRRSTGGSGGRRGPARRASGRLPDPISLRTWSAVRSGGWLGADARSLGCSVVRPSSRQ